MKEVFFCKKAILYQIHGSMQIFSHGEPKYEPRKAITLTKVFFCWTFAVDKNDLFTKKKLFKNLIKRKKTFLMFALINMNLQYKMFRQHFLVAFWQIIRFMLLT